MAHKKYPSFTTGRGVAVGWVNLNSPDTKFNKDGEFKVELAFDEDDEVLTEIEEAVTELAQEKLEEVQNELIEKGKKALANKVTVISLIKAEEDEETGEETGRKILKAKMRHSGTSQKTGKRWSRYPDYFNAKGVQLKRPPMIGAGSTLKANIELYPYYAANDKTVGVTFRLNGVQLINVVSFGERDASSYGFGAEDDGDDITDQPMEDQSNDVDDSGDDEDDGL
jgi:hypothetical protein